MAGSVKNKPRIFYGWYMVAALMFIAGAVMEPRGDDSPSEWVKSLLKNRFRSDPNS